MTEIGYTLSTEEHNPNALVEHAQKAEEVGFDFLSISDHYHPWVSQQGNSPFAWSVLGGVAAVTDEVDVGVGVTAPIIRYHPAMYAQMSATVAVMFDDRQFYAGVGTGESLNEHVFGDHWPEHEVRLEMLEEAVDVVRKLWTGEKVSHRGHHYTVENARLFTLPEEPPPLCVSAYGERAARAAAGLGDGFWSIGAHKQAIETWERRGGEGPRFCQLSVCVAESEDEGISTAHEQWPIAGLKGEMLSILPTPTHFEQATQMVSEQDIADSGVLAGPDAQPHIDTIQQALDMGYDHVYLHQIGDDQDALFDMYQEDVLPSFS